MVVICPFYVDENKATITCEDCCRSHDTTKDKWSWMDMYCNSWNWMDCPYAVEISAAYKRYEEGDVKALEKHETDALKKENRSLRIQLGQARKKVERQQKKIEKIEAVKESFVRKNEELYLKWRKADEKLRQQNDRIWGEIGSLTNIYEQRMCYLIEKYAQGKFYDDEAEEWAGDKAFALVHDYDDERRFWKVVYGSEETEDGYEDTDIQAEE